MNVIVNNLLRELISKKNNFREKSYKHEETFKKCRNILKTFHPLEINPKQVKEELNNLCFKLEMHSLHYKAKNLQFLCQKVVKLCDDYLDKDNYLLSHSIVLFLIDIHESLLHGGYEGLIDDTCGVGERVYDFIDWGHELRLSDDIIALTRNDYGSDTSLETIGSISEELVCDILDTAKVVEPSIVSYQLVRDHDYTVSTLEEACFSSLQSEYWMDSAVNNTLSHSLRQRGSPSFMDSWERHLAIARPIYYQVEVASRVGMTDYQFVREVLDVLLGAQNCTIWTLYLDTVAIVGNRYCVKKTCKVANLSWATLDNISNSLSVLATHCLHLRSVSKYIIDNCSRLTIAAPMIALGERFFILLSEFCQYVRELENRARGNVGLSLFELHNAVSVWAIRLTFLDDLLTSVTKGRFEAFQWHSTVVNMLDLLYNLMNQSCLLAIEPWTVNCIHKLFYHSLRPYLFSLDALLCGQTYFSSDNLFLAHNDSVSPSDIHHYYYHNFTIKKAVTQSLVTTIPILLHPFIVKLISTIKSIDLLRVLSIELTKPSIVNAIVKDPGTFINHFNSTVSIIEDNVVVRRYVANDSYINDHPLSRHIFADLISSLTRKVLKENRVTDSAVTGTEDLVLSCRQLHQNLSRDITDRYKSVNDHLISVYIGELALDQALGTIRSVYFLQAGVEMYDFCSILFVSLLEGHHTNDALTLTTNLKLQQVLSESVDVKLRAEAKNLVVRLQVDMAVGLEVNRMIATLSSVKIEYEVAWGLKLVITGEILTICNLCLRFLLQLRFAKHCLESAIQSERNKVLRRPCGQSSITQNRMRALRLKLLQIANSLHIYIMNTFIVPAWCGLADMMGSAACFEDFSDFIHRVREPFTTMARGCLQTEELAKFRKAIELVIALSIKVTRVEGGHEVGTLQLHETEYRRLVDFIGAMFKGLSNMGISINGLDMSAFV